MCRSADRKQYYQTNREAALAQQRQYREDNREAVLAHQRTPEARALRNASRNARNATPEGKLLKKSRKSPPQVLQRHKARACDSPSGAEALVGCTRQQYRDLLASQFKPGMTHENNGHGSDKWQIDHIIPQARV